MPEYMVYETMVHRVRVSVHRKTGVVQPAKLLVLHNH